MIIFVVDYFSSNRLTLFNQPQSAVLTQYTECTLKLVSSHTSFISLMLQYTNYLHKTDFSKGTKWVTKMSFLVYDVELH